MSRFGSRLVVFLGCAAFTGCGDPPIVGSVPVPAEIEVVAGSGQSAVVDADVPDALEVRVTDTDGDPVPDVSVQWTTASGRRVAHLWITDDLEAWCWGFGAEGRLGDGANLSRFTPVEVQGPQPFVEIEAGGGHTCGVGDRGLAYCWGFNGLGQVGDGTLTDRDTPTRITTSVRVTSFSLGQDQTCAATIIEGTLLCWGFDDGNLGVETAPLECDLTTMCVRVPSPVAGRPAYLTASQGIAFRCGVSGTAAACWGDNTDGKLGNGSTNPVGRPGCRLRRSCVCSGDRARQSRVRFDGRGEPVASRGLRGRARPRKAS